MSAPGGDPQGDSVPVGPREARLREAEAAILRVRDFADSIQRSVDDLPPDKNDAQRELRAWLTTLAIQLRTLLASPSPDEGAGVADAGASGDE